MTGVELGTTHSPIPTWARKAFIDAATRYGYTNLFVMRTRVRYEHVYTWWWTGFPCNSTYTTYVSLTMVVQPFTQA